MSAPRHCVITAGPTYEPLDQVRRLTNFSTGRLGTELANHLVAAGHHVTLLLGQSATCAGPAHAHQQVTFTTTADLGRRLQALSTAGVDAVFHAAAVSDYQFGKIWARSATGELTELQAGKLSTRDGCLLAELVPTPKLLTQLRGLFPAARIVGWKYEVDGNPAAVLAAARRQLAECHTDLCVANGPAYGPGFGLVTPENHVPQADAAALFQALAEWLHR
jgi:phosphopantothenoylcysteine decarboxylase/phosphopantothenate--cysteine ligase